MRGRSRNLTRDEEAELVSQADSRKHDQTIESICAGFGVAVRTYYDIKRRIEQAQETESSK